MSMGDLSFSAPGDSVFSRSMNRLLSISLFCSIFTSIPGAFSQTLGGQSVFNFVKLPNSPQVSALGGITTSVITRDIGPSFQNPALLREDMRGQVTAVFGMAPAGIKDLNALGGWRHDPWKTNFSLGVQYISYGQATQTDAAGNVLGDFRPRDMVVQAAFSRQYLERFHYGASLKYISSIYGPYRSSAIAVDMGITYTDSAGLFQAGFVAKNMGAQLKTYAGQGEDMPFDLQLGITKRLRHLPVQFSVTAHRLHQWDIAYRDTLFNVDNYGNPGKSGFADKLFRHFVFAVQGYIGGRVELTLGYNVLRGKELKIDNVSNGLTGFSYGVGVLLDRLQIRYARSQYQRQIAGNQLGISFDLNGKKR
jgi:hypothetical protein